ncbi:hypothetical protein GCM10009530_04060 [Microbispora corallina]|uniref:Uncharacterized protein n=1 Tax=Microbispora corallina TaxID=83302 RepID=A0ABQ4FRI7_9ACTN|nr:hypothetical protein Mco01_03670 [Microbispora corallina]
MRRRCGRRTADRTVSPDLDGDRLTAAPAGQTTRNRSRPGFDRLTHTLSGSGGVRGAAPG